MHLLSSAFECDVRCDREVGRKVLKVFFVSHTDFIGRTVSLHKFVSRRAHGKKVVLHQEMIHI